VPVLLSSLIDVPPGQCGMPPAADNVSRCCLREWLARVPDPRSVMGRWHPLGYVLALAVCAFTVAGHDGDWQLAEDLAVDACTKAWMAWRKVSQLAEDGPPAIFREGYFVVVVA